MNARLLYRIAAALFVLFALGHTYGFLSFKPPTAEAAAVREAMDRVPLAPGFTWGGFYVGFGLYISAYMAFSALLAWGLSGMAARAPHTIGFVAWSFFAVQLASLALACIYFPLPPAVFSALAAICLGAAAWMAGRGADKNLASAASR